MPLSVLHFTTIITSTYTCKMPNYWFSFLLKLKELHPFKRTKTSLWPPYFVQYIAMERKLLRWKAPGNWIERVTGTSPADRNILFRGIWLRMARSGLASFAVVGSYLFAVDHFFWLQSIWLKLKYYKWHRLAMKVTMHLVNFFCQTISCVWCNYFDLFVSVCRQDLMGYCHSCNGHLFFS